MKIKKTAMLALSLALGACLLAGCAKGAATEGGNTDSPDGGVYTITFDAGLGSFGSGSTVTRQTADGKLAASDKPSDPTYAGHTFDGWNTKADGKGDNFMPSTKYTADTTYYAQWKSGTTQVTPPANTGAYKITFDANGGTWEGSAPEVTTVGGKITAMPTAQPTRANYEFKGWNVSADGKGVEVTTNMEFSLATTVYAKWESAIPANDPTVTAVGSSGYWLVGDGVTGGSAADGWKAGVQFTKQGSVWVVYMTVTTGWLKVKDAATETGYSELANDGNGLAYTADDNFGGFNFFVNVAGRYKFTFDGTATTVENI